MKTDAQIAEPVVENEVLLRLRQALAALYGSRLERVILYGSRARGEARPDSDYDVAVFLTRAESFWVESGRLAEMQTQVLFETGAVVNALSFPVEAYSDRTPLMHELRRDGRDL